MKHLKQHVEDELVLPSIFSIVVLKNNRVMFTEQCDTWYSKTMPSSEAIELLEQMIKLIKRSML